MFKKWLAVGFGTLTLVVPCISGLVFGQQNGPGLRREMASYAPFHLTQEEAAQLDQVLEHWQSASDKIKSFKCPFERWVYDEVFGPGSEIPMTKSVGKLKYAKPDKGLFQITEILHYTPATDPSQPATWEANPDEKTEHWVCDGKAVYEFDGTQKRLIVNELPVEMQGKAIADGPLPFLFGAEKEKLKARYFLRISRNTPDEIWIETHPRWQRDAANYKQVKLILDRESFLPSALEVSLPNGKTREVYIFKLEHAKVNDPLERFIGVFQQPRTPLGWKKEIRRAPPLQSAARPPQGRLPQVPRR